MTQAQETWLIVYVVGYFLSFGFWYVLASKSEEPKKLTAWDNALLFILMLIWPGCWVVAFGAILAQSLIDQAKPDEEAK